MFQLAMNILFFVVLSRKKYDVVKKKNIRLLSKQQKQFIIFKHNIYVLLKTDSVSTG